MVAQCSVQQARKPEGAGLSTGGVRKGIRYKTIAKSFLRAGGRGQS